MFKFFCGESVYYGPGHYIIALMIGPRQDLMTSDDNGRRILSLLDVEIMYPWWFRVRSDWREILRRQPDE